ncbi:MAG: hypothetical protein KDA84_19900 [Planctomycetaceae bacterium]|nr:hypothetical protein [Planctomycetaceae bacterium]
MPSSYLSLDQLLTKVDEPYRSGFEQLMQQNHEEFRLARGSTRNHQAWRGGYIDHVQEVMNLAVVQYTVFSQLRPLPFSLSDALVVLFVHDLEKPWAYEQVGDRWQRREGLKEQAHEFRMAKLKQSSIDLSPELENAVLFVEGEGANYTNHSRGMSPLAAFCHMCDVASARLWYDYPLESDDPWKGAARSAS